MTTTLQKLGNSQGVILPNEILKTALLTENETEIKIEKVKKIEILEDIFKNYNGKYCCQEIDTGMPVGKEVW